MAFHGFSGFVARSRGSFVLVVACVADLCILSTLNVGHNFSDIVSGSDAAVGICTQFCVVSVCIWCDGESVRNLHVGVGLEKHAEARVRAIEVGVVS